MNVTEITALMTDVAQGNANFVSNCDPVKLPRGDCPWNGGDLFAKSREWSDFRVAIRTFGFSDDKGPRGGENGPPVFLRIEEDLATACSLLITTGK